MICSLMPNWVLGFSSGSGSTALNVSSVTFVDKTGHSGIRTFLGRFERQELRRMPNVGFPPFLAETGQSGIGPEPARQQRAPMRVV